MTTKKPSKHIFFKVLIALMILIVICIIAYAIGYQVGYKMVIDNAGLFVLKYVR